MKQTLTIINKTRYMQYLAVLCAALFGFCTSTIRAWASPSIAKLISSDSPIGVTLDSNEASWVAAIPSLGGIAGSFVFPIFLNIIGSKGTLLFSAIPLAASWFGIAFTKSVVVLIAMRFTSGIANAFILTSLSIYIGEVADKDIRGKLSTCYPILSSIGNLCVLSIGPFISYQVLTLICAAFPIIFGIIFFFMPQSPYHLLRKKKTEECKSCLRSLLSNDTTESALDDRVNEILLTIKTKTKNKYNVCYVFSKKNFRISIFLALNVGLLSAFSGVATLKSYLQTIIGLTTSSISPQVSSIIFGVVQLPSVILAAFLSDKLGRKIILIISALGCAVTLGAEGVYFFLQDVVKTDLRHLSWLPTACLTIYLIVLPIGISAVPSIIRGEIFADDIKSVASAICSVFTSLGYFLTSLYFLPLSEEWGMHVMFWIFSGICLYGTLFASFVLPETKGKSFLEIQEILSNKHFC